MANYNTLNEALAANLENMIVLRDNVKNDDTTVEYETGITWFKFNNKVVSSIYSSGNSWLGLGTKSELLKINRRDSAVYYEFYEVGKIHLYRFYKFSWIGYSAYNKNDSSYYLSWDVFLFENGLIFLNFRNIPYSSFDGTFLLVCETTLIYTTPTISACQYTFTPMDPEKGMSWKVEFGQPKLPIYYSNGYIEYSILEASSLLNVLRTRILWLGSEPEGTSILILAKSGNSGYVECTNNSPLPISISDGSDLSIKIILNSNRIKTPILYNLELLIYDLSSYKKIILIFNRGNVNSFLNSISPVEVIYSGAGRFIGYGGPVATFSENFVPIGLQYKHNPCEKEHINFNSASASGNLIKVTYIGCYEKEHLVISDVSATSSLIYVEDN